MAKDVVFGLAEYYQAEVILPFVETLLATGYSGDIVFFVRKLPFESLEYLKRKGVKTIPYRRMDFRGIWRARVALNSLLGVYRRLFGVESVLFEEKLVKWFWHCQASRFLYYHEYLKNTDTDYNMVMISDVRDVFFQKKPFDFNLNGEVFAFEEYDQVSIKEQSHNRNWIRELFGQDGLEELGTCRITCSGVTMGTRSGMLQYLEIMNRLIARRHGGSHGFDQGIHNYLVHTGMMESLQIVPYRHGPVFNVAIAPTSSIKLSSQGLFLNANGEPFNVVHQYDRHPELMKKHASSDLIQA